MQPDPELISEDATLLREAMRRMVRYAVDATEVLVVRIEDRTLEAISTVAFSEERWSWWAGVTLV